MAPLLMKRQPRFAKKIMRSNAPRSLPDNQGISAQTLRSFTLSPARDY
jgi:hypothetical protein